MKIALGSDHGGFNLKNLIIDHLKQKGIECEDLGCHSTDSCDYPEFGLKVAKAVKSKEYDFGIIVCGTGIGISIAANKVPGIRAAHCTDSFTARATRQHNNSNILALGERITGPSIALDIVDAFLSTDFEGGRHEKRVNMIEEIEKEYLK
ncbi:ribose 5-phosphate isomerase B [Clostridium cylindrosporum]|uniref:Ribose-5-phosphate isomerase B n=1 Tax=Clostridium cylindrosporum DSM 605 TaxID=1121307 RepID=A0A0J8D9R2_CLOCY|nr:ribose 5-phosphate isomerase B [Clostridium cylindrosporum]KMT22795.1 ribose-5-phosphate isomerase B [Clostridium cylindrosporum DSM 605]